jgi:hypothetical protein
MAKARNHEASTVGGRETERLTPVGKAIFGMVSEPTGCNASEHQVASKIPDPGAEHLCRMRKQNVRPKTGNIDRISRRGGNGGMLVKDMSRDWRNPNRPGEKSLEKGWFYNRKTGKEPEDGRAADGSVVAMRGGNALGAKGPC